MDREADLEAALRFVTGRIREQAERAGEQLTNEQSFLLDYLPSSPVSSMQVSTPLYPKPTPGNANYERLSALGKSAYLSDGGAAATPDWEFALAVFKLNDHPMHSLLREAGAEANRPPWWDRALLLIAALLFTAISLGLMLITGAPPSTLLQWLEFGLAYLVILALIYIVTRRMKERQLEKEIDKCRASCRFVSPIKGQARIG